MASALSCLQNEVFELYVEVGHVTTKGDESIVPMKQDDCGRLLGAAHMVGRGNGRES